MTTISSCFLLGVVVLVCCLKKLWRARMIELNQEEINFVSGGGYPLIIILVALGSGVATLISEYYLQDFLNCRGKYKGEDCYPILGAMVRFWVPADGAVIGILASLAITWLRKVRGGHDFMV